MKGPQHKSADFARPRANAGEILCLEAWEVKEKIQERLPILETLQGKRRQSFAHLAHILKAQGKTQLAYQAICSAEALLQVATFGKRANSVHRAGALFAPSFTVY